MAMLNPLYLFPENRTAEIIKTGSGGRSTKPLLATLPACMRAAVQSQLIQLPAAAPGKAADKDQALKSPLPTRETQMERLAPGFWLAQS